MVDAGAGVDRVTRLGASKTSNIVSIPAFAKLSVGLLPGGRNVCRTK